MLRCEYCEFRLFVCIILPFVVRLASAYLNAHRTKQTTNFLLNYVLHITHYKSIVFSYIVRIFHVFISLCYTFSRQRFFIFRFIYSYIFAAFLLFCFPFLFFAAFFYSISYCYYVAGLGVAVIIITYYLTSNFHLYCNNKRRCAT